MSVAIGASRGRSAQPTRPPPARACSTWSRRVYNAAGLGLPIVMTVANRAIGAPINIWNDHSDAMSQRDSGWIQLYAQTNQDAADLHVLAFRLAEELSTPVMVCMDGFILTHAFEAVDVPEPGAGRRVPAAVPAAAGARPGRPGLDRGDGRARGLHRGALPGPPHQLRRARGDPARSPTSSPTLFGRRCGGLVSRTASTTPRPSSWRSARCSAPSRTPSTSCAPRACRVGVLGITAFRPFPFDALRAALARRAAGRRAGAGPGGRRRRHRLRRRPARRCRAERRRVHRGRRPGRPADHPGSLQRLARRRRGRPAGAADLPGPRPRPWSSADHGEVDGMTRAAR